MPQLYRWRVAVCRGTLGDRRITVAAMTATAPGVVKRPAQHPYAQLQLWLHTCDARDHETFERHVSRSHVGPPVHFDDPGIPME